MHIQFVVVPLLLAFAAGTNCTNGKTLWECESEDETSLVMKNAKAHNGWKGDKPLESFKLFGEGACKGGWIRGSNRNKMTLTKCAQHCSNRGNCGFFSFDTKNKKCSLYTRHKKCPRDSKYPTYDSYCMGLRTCPDAGPCDDDCKGCCHRDFCYPELTKAVCLSIEGATWLGSIPCDDSCETCCKRNVRDPDSCEDMSKQDCVDGGNEWLGEDSDCDASCKECCHNAVCYPVTKNACDILGANWMGTCEDCRSCCVDETCFEVPKSDCDDIGGSWNGGDGETCNDDCWGCCHRGICYEMAKEKCDMTDAVYLGPDPTGPCDGTCDKCCRGSFCYDVPQSECEEAGGNWKGGSGGLSMHTLNVQCNQRGIYRWTTNMASFQRELLGVPPTTNLGDKELWDMHIKFHIICPACDLSKLTGHDGYCNGGGLPERPNQYGIQSLLCSSAVHAGVIKEGEAGHFITEYVRGTIHDGLKYPGSTENGVKCWATSDYREYKISPYTGPWTPMNSHQSVLCSHPIARVDAETGIMEMNKTVVDATCPPGCPAKSLLKGTADNEWHVQSPLCASAAAQGKIDLAKGGRVSLKRLRSCGGIPLNKCYTFV